MKQATPNTKSKALAVNTSGMRLRATARNTGRSHRRPPRTTAATAATARNAQGPGQGLGLAQVAGVAVGEQPGRVRGGRLLR